MCRRAGGVYNPAVLDDGDGLLVVVRDECYPLSEIVLSSLKLFTSCRNLLLRYGRDWELQTTVEPDIVHLRSRSRRQEDVRLFRHGGAVYCNFHVVDLHRPWRRLLNRLPGTYGLLDRSLRNVVIGGIRVRVAFARFDAASGRLQNETEPVLDFPLQRYEKNWAFLSAHGEIHAIYTLRPYVVLRFAGSRRATGVTHLRTTVAWPDWLPSAHMLSLSCNPVAYDDRHLLCALHYRDAHKIYRHWAFLIDRTTLLPTAITARPLITGEHVREGLPGASILMALLVRETAVELTIGEGDLRCRRATLPRAELDRCWLPLPSA